MCGRFSQSRPRDEYLSLLPPTLQSQIAFDPEPVDRYNVAPGTKVLLLNMRNHAMHLDSVLWSYAPDWWHKPPLINARVETASTSRMFKSLWEHGRGIVFADGWYEWVKEGASKQPYFIHRKDHKPIFLAAIGKEPFDRQSDAEGFLIVTSAARKGLLDIHDRRPVVLHPDAAMRWIDPDCSSADAENIATNEDTLPDELAWYPVSKAVGNVKNNGADLIRPIT